MKGLNWKQPYAELMFHGKIETRTWQTKYRGEVLILQSKLEYNLKTILRISGDVQYQRTLNIFYPSSSDKPASHPGHAVGVATLIDCRPMNMDDEDKCYVKYSSGLWCHIYTDVRRIVPFPIKGAQRWKNLDTETISKIIYL